jgi:hypothetical protein
MFRKGTISANTCPSASALIHAGQRTGAILDENGMTRDEIIAKPRAMEPELRARGMTRMRMSGARARGGETPHALR